MFEDVKCCQLVSKKSVIVVHESLSWGQFMCVDNEGTSGMGCCCAKEVVILMLVLVYLHGVVPVDSTESALALDSECVEQVSSSDRLKSACVGALS